MSDKIRGIFGFIGCPDHQRFMDERIPKLGVKYCIETGTLHGWTTAFFAERIEHVYTIEVVGENAQKAEGHLKGYDNVRIVIGSSPTILPSLLKLIPSDEKILFYLDAHWGDYWPLFDELDIIAKQVGPRAVIVIDDFKVPNKEYSFDTYGGVETSLESVEPYLKRIYPSYSYEYFGGELDYEVVLNEDQLNDVEQNLYKTWFVGQRRRTTGKILIYEHKT